jgi:hypothetical protein
MRCNPDTPENRRDRKNRPPLDTQRDAWIALSISTGLHQDLLVEIGWL